MGSSQLMRVVILCTCAVLAVLSTMPEVLATGDADNDGYIGVTEIDAFNSCFAGPGIGVSTACAELFDDDQDDDVDMQDAAAFARRLGHLPFQLLDGLSQALTAWSTEPYSPRQTCGACHDVDAIANGFHFQQGRTNLDGNIQVHDDFFGDGRIFIRSPGMYGKW